MSHSSTPLSLALLLGWASLGHAQLDRQSPEGAWQFGEDLSHMGKIQSSAQVLYLDSWSQQKSWLASVYHPLWAHFSVGYGAHYRPQSQELDWGGQLFYPLRSAVLSYGMEQRQVLDLALWTHSLGLQSPLLRGLDLNLGAYWNSRDYQGAMGLRWQGHPRVILQSDWIFRKDLPSQWRLTQSWQVFEPLQIYSQISSNPLRMGMGIALSLQPTPGHKLESGAMRTYHRSLSPSQSYSLQWSKSAPQSQDSTPP